jgi:hypothetical protein
MSINVMRDQFRANINLSLEGNEQVRGSTLITIKLTEAAWMRATGNCRLPWGLREGLQSQIHDVRCPPLGKVHAFTQPTDCQDMAAVLST